MIEPPDSQPISRVCPVCRGSSRRSFLKKGALSLDQCTACSMIYAAHAPSAFTDGHFYQIEGSQFYASDEKLAGDYSPVRYDREVRLLHRFCNRGKVLDVGCSTGGFLHSLQARFPSEYQVIGTDVATGALEIAASKGIEILRDDFLTLTTAVSSFDAITFWAVLEHVEDPGAFLRKTASLLNDGGTCFILVPNVKSLAVRILGGKYRYILPQHLNYFSNATLRQLAERCGLQVVCTTTMHFNPVVIFQDLRSRERLVPDRDRARLLVRTNALKANPLLSPLRCCYRAAERLLALGALADNIALVARPAKRP